MNRHSAGIKKNAHWVRLIPICFIAAAFVLFGTNNPANGEPEKPMEGIRFLLYRHQPPLPTPTPTPTLTPTPTPTLTPTPTPTATPSPTIIGLLGNSAAGSSAGLAIGSMAGIFFILRRKDKD